MDPPHPTNKPAQDPPNPASKYRTRFTFTATAAPKYKAKLVAKIKSPSGNAGGSPKHVKALDALVSGVFSAPFVTATS
jgi:hypothetical protein